LPTLKEFGVYRWSNHVQANAACIQPQSKPCHAQAEHIRSDYLDTTLSIAMEKNISMLFLLNTYAEIPEEYAF
jgi:hypothetical protein